MQLNTELKMNGKAAMMKNYWPCVGVSFIVSLLTGGGGSVSTVNNLSDASDITESVVEDTATGLSNITDSFSLIPGWVGGVALGLVVAIAIVVLIFSFFVCNVIEVGGNRFFIENRTSAPGAGLVFDGFRSGHYMNIVKALFFRDLFVFLWGCLLIIPGIVKGLEYMMVPYILAENPAMDRKDAFALSKQMMDGEKANAFWLGLSFIGWYLLSVFTCGILAIFFVNPYEKATFAELYAYNKEKAFRQGWIH